MIEVTDGRCVPGTPGAIGGKRELGVFPLEKTPMRKNQLRLDCYGAEKSCLGSPVSQPGPAVQVGLRLGAGPQKPWEQLAVLWILISLLSTAVGGADPSGIWSAQDLRTD